MTVIYSLLDDPERLKELEEKLGISKEEIQRVTDALREDAKKHPAQFKNKEDLSN